MKLSDPVTGWSMDCLMDGAGNPPPGGLVLQTITHDGHSFAKDIRCVGFWIETELVDPSGAVVSTAAKLHLLDSTTFTVSAVEELKPKPLYSPTYKKTFDYLKESDAALQFTEYFKQPGGNYVAYGVKATFAAPALMASFPNCVYDGLTVEQLFLFSSYGNSPKHEPSGGLSAARFHPMVRYAFLPNPAHDPKQQHTRIKSIRFDYRLYLFVDRHYDVATNASLAQIGNQAGVFADSDSVAATVLTAIGSGIWNITKPNTVTTAVAAGSFDSVEKPVVLELIAPGLANGFSVFTTLSGGRPVKVRCWDNVHWWGSRGRGSPLISTPGAFHCAHLHWRWGGAAYPAVGGTNPRFSPLTWPAGMPVHPAVAGMWGPLVDPAIWIQSIRIAVTQNDPRLDPAKGVSGGSLTKADWKTLFKPALRPAPLDIYAGADIVLWYSSEVHGRVTVPTSSTNVVPPAAPPPPPTYTSASGGTVFIHGIFFAHDAEKTGLVGSTAPAHRPTTEAAIRTAASWFRSAGFAA